MDATHQTGVATGNGATANNRWEWGIHEALRLPQAYASYLILSAMDAVGTGLILWFGGWEVNPITNAVLKHFGFPGMIVMKFALVTLVIVNCEHIVRERPATAKCVIGLAIGVSVLPVVIAIVELTCHALLHC